MRAWPAASSGAIGWDSRSHSPSFGQLSLRGVSASSCTRADQAPIFGATSTK